MKGFLFDENLPSKVLLESNFKIIHVTELGESLSDSKIWKIAQEKDLVIVTKDTDYYYKIIAQEPPPRVVHIKFGNTNLLDFNAMLSKFWPTIQNKIQSNKLIEVYRNKLTIIS